MSRLKFFVIFACAVAITLGTTLAARAEEQAPDQPVATETASSDLNDEAAEPTAQEQPNDEAANKTAEEQDNDDETQAAVEETSCGCCDACTGQKDCVCCDHCVCKYKTLHNYFQKTYLGTKISSSISNVLFIVFLIAVFGYAIGRFQIGGVGLGTAGVFLVALVFGHFGYSNDSLFHKWLLVTTDEKTMLSSMKLVEQLGLLCFVTSVGFIAGPKFFANLRRNAASYGLLAFVIIGSAALACWAVIKFTDIGSPMAVGILSGSLTTTPGFSAAKEALQDDKLQEIVTVGHAIGYPFGVVGVVLFVQLVPIILRANITEEQKKINASGDGAVEKELPANLIKFDPIGLCPFALAIILGVFLGKISFPLPGGATFALGNTGGALIVGLLLGHFGRIGCFHMRPSVEFLRSFREFGLVLFLIGAGVPGGGGFVDYLQEYGWMLFAYGAIMELVPMFLGFLVARYVVKLCLFNNLGSITGGMTSTPALGALINTAKTDDVAAAYAATYPVALVLVVLASQMLVVFF